MGSKKLVWGRVLMWGRAPWLVQAEAKPRQQPRRAARAPQRNCYRRHLKLKGYNPGRSRARNRNPEAAGPALSRGQMRPHPRQRMGTAGRDHPLRAIDRRKRQPRNAGVVPKISDGRRRLPRSLPNSSSRMSGRPDSSATNPSPSWEPQGRS